MENEVDNKFTWVIKNFSSLKSEKIYSDTFVIGGCRWRLLAYPKGNKSYKTDNVLSLYLDVVDSESLPSGWRRHMKFSFTIVNQRSEKLSLLKETEHWFDSKERDWGFGSMFPLSCLHKDDHCGFLENGELKIVVEIVFLEVIGKLDVAESLSVNGFHVLPSQGKSVNRLFERHPEIATKLRVKNQYLKTGYMNALLSLSETLRQSPMKISKYDLADAYFALESMTDAGFELDWLKKKLDQASEKKAKEEAGEVRIKELEEELNDLKKKCSDIEAQLEKEKAEVLAARAPPLLSDDF